MHTTIYAPFLAVDILLMILVVLLNLTVIVILLVKSKVRKSKNIFLLSLAIADMCVGIFVIPNIISMTFLHATWRDVMCKLCLYAEHAVNAASAFSISVMAIDRMRAIMFPLRFRSVRHVFSYAAFILVWLVALTYALRAPFLYGAVTSITNVTETNVTIVKVKCTVSSELFPIHRGLVYLDFFLLFLLPSSILVVCNVIVSVRLTAKPTVQISGSVKRLMRKRRRSIRLLFAMVIIFVGCHMPLYAFRLHKLVHTSYNPPSPALILGLLILSWCNSVVNVIFYGSLNDEVKATFISIARCRCKMPNNRVSALSVSTVKTTTTTVPSGQPTTHVMSESRP